MAERGRISVSTPVGTLVLEEEQGRLSGVTIIPPGVAPPAKGSSESPLLTLARTQVEEYFSGIRRSFTLPLRIPGWRPFSLQVLARLRTVPYGATISYGEIAAQAGSERAARAVGRVMAANPLPIVIPCHRVLAANGRIGGYSGGGGLLTKKWLLDFEQCHAGEMKAQPFENL